MLDMTKYGISLQLVIGFWLQKFDTADHEDNGVSAIVTGVIVGGVGGGIVVIIVTVVLVVTVKLRTSRVKGNIPVSMFMLMCQCTLSPYRSAC